MEFEEILDENDSKSEVYIGYAKKKQMAKINLKDNPSLIITGETGTGKSILLDQILCQLIINNTSLELELALIDSSGVELNLYSESRYAKYVSIKDNDKAQVVIQKVLNEMDKRYETIKAKGYTTVDEYNAKEEESIPTLCLAIDDNGTLINTEDISKALTALIRGIGNVNIYLIAAFSNTNNYFFNSNKNLYSSGLVSFDLADSEVSGQVNIVNAENLKIGKFIYNGEEYHNFDFDDEIIVDVLN